MRQGGGVRSSVCIEAAAELHPSGWVRCGGARGGGVRCSGRNRWLARWRGDKEVGGSEAALQQHAFHVDVRRLPSRGSQRRVARWAKLSREGFERPAL